MSEKQQGSDRLLKPREVAARYGMSLQWVYHCPELKAIRRRVGKYLFYRLSDLEKLETMDRDKATGGKTMPLDAARRKAEAEFWKRNKFGVQ